MWKVKPILAPPDTLSPAKYRKAIDRARGLAEAAAVSEALTFSRRWKHKPQWRVERHGADQSDVVTDDEIFAYQDQGTRPHVIVPSKKRALFWPSASHPVKRVNHPGTKPQRYSEKLAAIMQKQYERVMRDELAKAAQ